MNVTFGRVGEHLYKKIFEHYTLKQWDVLPAVLGAEVTARIPVTSSFDDRYFKDKYQALPLHGYTKWFETVLDNPLIQVVLGVDYFSVRNELKGRCGKLIYTGPVDRYFASSGMEKLEYRSIIFKKRVYPLITTEYMLNAAVVNYPGKDVAYTRIVEYKHMLNQSSLGSVLVEEYSTAHGDPYYPVPTQRNKDLYSKYQTLAAKEPGVYFVGRLANYKYMNMDVAIDNALSMFTQIEGMAHLDIRQPSVSKPSINIIVAYYNEDLSWLSEFCKYDIFTSNDRLSWYFYVKGPNTAEETCSMADSMWRAGGCLFPVDDVHCRKLENVGREGHTQLTYMMQENATGRLGDVNIFLQGKKEVPTRHLADAVTKSMNAPSLLATTLSFHGIQSWNSPDFPQLLESSCIACRWTLQLYFKMMKKTYHYNSPSAEYMYRGEFVCSGEAIVSMLTRRKAIVARIYKDLSKKDLSAAGFALERLWLELFKQ